MTAGAAARSARRCKVGAPPCLLRLEKKRKAESPGADALALGRLEGRTVLRLRGVMTIPAALDARVAVR